MGYILAFLFLFADRFLKYLALYKLSFFENFNDNFFLKIVLYKNHGGVFGILPGNILIIFLSLIALLFLIYLFLINKASRIAIVFIICGAFSNLFDRVYYGFVVDYINLYFYWWIFNIADIIIFFGALFFIIRELKKGKNLN